ncbi:enoyl-CoA hydratase/isomerase family protein [Achromobacter insuavis]
MNPPLPVFPTLLLEAGDGIATLTLNQPATLNAIDVAMALDLQRAAQWLETRADIRVVLLRGAGKAFCAGGDITLFEGDVNAVRGKLLDLFTPLNDFVAHVARMDTLWLAQVHGVAAGAGLSLVLACDLAIAEADTRFMTAYLKLGATPDAGMTHGLNRLLGPRRALDLLRHDAFNAADALGWGLLNRVADTGLLAQQAQAYASQLASHAPHGIAGAKHLLRNAAHARSKRSWPKKPPASWKPLGARISPKACAFREKRAPRFQGR